ncbi:MAG: lipopolysaccharide heptosyltransferase II [Candidatus Omnitrophica bacterium]|nr:lipopolysaccharide heptosyltransferase II [Candidatus Omnitrophota bacterium]
MKQERILVFTKNWLGDVIFEEPFIRALKRKWESAYIICVTNYRCRDILTANPYVDEVIGFDDRKKDKGIIAALRLIKLLKEKKITKAFILHRSFSRALIVWLASIPERFGYNTKQRGFLLTQPIQEPTQKMHRVDYFLHILKETLLFIEDSLAYAYSLYYDTGDERFVESLLASHEVTPHSFIAIHPGGNWDKKRWPTAYFIELINKLNEHYDVPCLITGTSDDDALAKQIIAGIKGKKPISLCGKTNIIQLGALFHFAQFVISADSGPLHIASGVGTPVVALFGPTDAVITGPRGNGIYFVLQNLPEQCDIPCFQERCSTSECMKRIKADDVLNCIKKNTLVKAL